MRYAKIKLNDVANGEGVSLSLWTQGCPHHCPSCFNPDTWDFNKGKEFTEETYSYIFDNIDNHNIKRNLSILGGEPLCPENIGGVLYLCYKFKEKYPNRKIYLWTGYTLDNLLKVYPAHIFESIDVIIDGRYVEDKKDLSLKLRGSSNQRLIKVRETLSENKIILL